MEDTMTTEEPETAASNNHLFDSLYAYGRAYAKRVARHHDDIFDDIIQELEVTILEYGLDRHAKPTEDAKRLIANRLSGCVRDLRPQGVSFDSQMHAATRERVKIVYAHQLRGPQKTAKTKQARWRHKNLKNGCCERCGEKLPDSECTRCLKCRAIKRWETIRRNPNAKRRKSKFDDVLKEMGFEI